MNLGDLRKAVRDRVDLDETELPNDVLDPFIQEGFNRIIQLETRWPFFEQQWSFPVAAEAMSFELPTDVAEAVAIRTAKNRLVGIEHRDGEDYYGFEAVIGEPRHWSKIGRTVFLWPTPEAAADITIRGFRLPTDWVPGGAGSEVDADVRLHLPIVNYALSVVYAQQEDEVLANQYLGTFREGAAVAHAAVMRPWREESLILGGRRSKKYRFPSPWGNLALITPQGGEDPEIEGGGP